MKDSICYIDWVSDNNDVRDLRDLKDSRFTVLDN